MPFFELLAECSIALGGFAAIHAALQGSTGPRGAFRAWGIVAPGLGAFLLSLLPLFLVQLELSEAAMWRLASASGLVLCGGLAMLSLYIDWRLSVAGHPAQIPWVLGVSQILNVFSVPAMAANLLGWPWTPGAPLYAASLLALIGSAVAGLLGSFWINLRGTLETSLD